MLLRKKMIPLVIGSLAMTVFSAAAISATNTFLSSPQEATKTASLLAYADKTETGEDSPSSGHKDLKSKKGHAHSKMSDVDLDGDGKISKDEFLKHHETMFDKKDLNGDGYIDEDEMRKIKEEMRKMMKEKHGHGH